MLVINPNECIHCGACEPECPVEAIFEDDCVPEKWNDYVKTNADVTGSYSNEELDKNRITSQD
jgi:ferredoxin